MNRSILLVLALGACTQTDSQHVDTEAMFAQYSIVNTESGTIARASYKVGASSNTYVDIGGDDSIWCDATRLGTRQSALGSVSYSSMLPTRAAGERYRFELRRLDEDVITDVQQVASLQLLGAASPSVNVGAGLAVSWTPDPNNALIDLTLGGPCIDTLLLSSEPDDGTTTLPATTLKAGETAGCTATLTVTRVLRAGVDPTFDGGLAETMSTRSRSVQIQP